MMILQSWKRSVSYRKSHNEDWVSDKTLTWYLDSCKPGIKFTESNSNYSIIYTYRFQFPYLFSHLILPAEREFSNIPLGCTVRILNVSYWIEFVTDLSYIISPEPHWSRGIKFKTISDGSEISACIVISWVDTFLLQRSFYLALPTVVQMEILCPSLGYDLLVWH